MTGQAELETYLRFPSISANPAHAGDLRACAEWLRDTLRGWGLAAHLEETGGPPVVLAESAPRPGVPTLLIYGHYDVQPVDPLDIWQTPPFIPSERAGFIHARGATDNKGQTMSLLLGVKRMLARDGGAPVNLRIIAEGEEEIGSPHFFPWLEAHKAALACDVALIADTSMIAPGWPSITLGLRGILCYDLVIHGPRADLHSGMFGGAVKNPAGILCRILAALHDADGRITIPGFEESVPPIPQSEADAWAGLPWDEAWFTRATGAPPDGGERARPVLERVWARPTAEINGLAAGHQGSGSKTIIPVRASAKLSFRLAPGQSVATAAAQVEAWFQVALFHEGARGELIADHGGEPFHLSPDHRHIQSAAAAVREVFGCPPAWTREGLSIPAAVGLQRTLGVPVVLLGLGLPDCQAHAPNESFPLAHLDLGARFLEAFCQRLAASAR